MATAQTLAGTGYDLVTTFDCLHDMGDPLGAARRVREALAPDGTWLVVEPNAADTVEGNLNPVGRLYYNGSLFLCVPNALSQPGGYALGAQAGEAAVREIAAEAGFTRFRRREAVQPGVRDPAGWRTGMSPAGARRLSSADARCTGAEGVNGFDSGCRSRGSVPRKTTMISLTMRRKTISAADKRTARLSSPTFALAA